ncbi:MAG: type II toxin-antitoxin system PemK/MazF family toxin [Brevundimonas sp.]|uniref:type II toxin-antitoxin system PemK/MazF family toxin n=1 Tax=Brevundimonas sp. TaxID=1871086 RepID=UPI004033FA89
MPTFEAGTVVRAPFPYTDRDTRQWRPAVVVSDGGVGLGERLCWVLMVTSAENRAWPGDVELTEDFRSAGLPVASLIRTAKIATVELDRLEGIGRLPDAVHEAVRGQLRERLGLG